MPKGVIKTKSQEKKWDKAKEAAADQGKSQRWPLIMHIFKQMGGLNKEDNDRNAKIEAALAAQGRKTTIPQEAHDVLHSWWSTNKDQVLSPEMKQRMADIKAPKEKRAQFKIVKSKQEILDLQKSLEYLKTAVSSDLFKAKSTRPEWSPSRQYSAQDTAAMQPHLDAGHSLQEAAHLSGVDPTRSGHSHQVSELSPAMMQRAKAAALDWVSKTKQREALEAKPEHNPEKFVSGKAAEIGQSASAAAKSYADSLKEHKASISHMPPDEQLKSIQKFKSDWHASPAAKMAHVDAAKSHADFTSQAKEARSKELYEQRKNILMGGQGLDSPMSTHTDSAMDRDEDVLSQEDLEDIHGGDSHLGKTRPNIEFADILEKISKKQSMQMLGNDPKAKEIADFISDKKLRDDTGNWLIRNYRKDPSIWNDENKKAIEHFSGMGHADEVNKVRFSKDHDFNSGIQMWKDAEKKYQDKHAESGHLIEPDSNTKKIVDLGNGWGWHDLGKGSCSKEAKAMGHCGNEPSEVEGDRVLSLRHDKKIGDKTYHEPHLTFIENGGTLGEMKGRANEKPNPRYHQAIAELLKNPRIHTLMGGGYAEESNFGLKDMDPKLVQEIKAKNPSLEEGITKENIDKMPKKYIENVLQSPHATLAHVDKAMNDENDYVRAAAVRSPLATSAHVDKAMNDKDWGVRFAALESPHATAAHVDKAMNDDHENVRLAALRSPHFTSAHVDKAMDDESPDVRGTAVRSPHVTPAHVDKAMDDEHWYVREAAFSSQHATPAHIDKAINDKSYDVTAAALNHNATTQAHIDKAMNHKDPDIRALAVNSRHATPAHIDKAMNDKDPGVREIAREVKQGRMAQ